MEILGHFSPSKGVNEEKVLFITNTPLQSDSLKRTDPSQKWQQRCVLKLMRRIKASSSEVTTSFQLLKLLMANTKQKIRRKRNQTFSSHSHLEQAEVTGARHSGAPCQCLGTMRFLSMSKELPSGCTDSTPLPSSCTCRYP